MKTTILIIGILFNAGILLAQDLTASKKTSFINQSPILIATNLKKTEGAAMLPANDVATNIARSPELSVFLKAIQTVGLIETFKSKGPITVFAPNNQAFANLSAGKLDTLLRADHKYDLIALITYHAIAGIVTARNIIHEINSNKGVATFITLTGSKLTAKLDNNRNILLIDENGGQSIISRFNLGQSNGLIHITNAVLIPKFKKI